MECNVIEDYRSPETLDSASCIEATQLYGPLTMPPELIKAHHKLDAAVDAAYSKKKFSGDSDRVAFLFELYQQLNSPCGHK